MGRLVAIAGCLSLGVLACGGTKDPAVREVAVRVHTVTVDRFDTPVVILEEEGGSRVLPIWIGPAEATSISAQLLHRPSPRPNSHDLAKRLIQSMDGQVLRVVVTDLREGTYYATLVLQARGKSVEIDLRPSDAIALALRVDAPILVRENLFETADDAIGTDDAGQSVSFAPAPRPSARGSEPATALRNL
jgi:bifunctional DNase/RNase